MNHLRWVAWGVINPDDKQAFDRMQRRNYIKRLRTELEAIGAALDCGGSSTQPWYQFVFAPEHQGHIYAYSGKRHAVGGQDAFKKIAQWALQELGDTQQSVENADGVE